MTYPETSNHHHYVSVRDPDSDRRGLLLGPFRTRQEAEALVDLGVRLARQVDDDAHWYTYGTTRVHTRKPKPGRLNALAGLRP